MPGVRAVIRAALNSGAARPETRQAPALARPPLWTADAFTCCQAERQFGFYFRFCHGFHFYPEPSALNWKTKQRHLSSQQSVVSLGGADALGSTAKDPRRAHQGALGKTPPNNGPHFLSASSFGNKVSHSKRHPALPCLQSPRFISSFYFLSFLQGNQKVVLTPGGHTSCGGMRTIYPQLVSGGTSAHCCRRKGM